MLVNPLMGPTFVVEGRVFLDYTIQMLLTQNDHVIQAFSAERTHESFTVRVRLGGGYRRWDELGWTFHTHNIDAKGV